MRVICTRSLVRRQRSSCPMMLTRRIALMRSANRMTVGWLPSEWCRKAWMCLVYRWASTRRTRPPRCSLPRPLDVLSVPANAVRQRQSLFLRLSHCWSLLHRWKLNATMRLTARSQLMTKTPCGIPKTPWSPRQMRVSQHRRICSISTRPWVQTQSLMVCSSTGLPGGKALRLVQSKNRNTWGFPACLMQIK